MFSSPINSGLAFSSASLFHGNFVTQNQFSSHNRCVRNRNVIFAVSKSATGSSSENGAASKNGVTPKNSSTTTKKPVKKKSSVTTPSSSNIIKSPVDDTSAGLVGEMRQLLHHILVIHCGGTFGMDVKASYDGDGKITNGGIYRTGLQPGGLLADILEHFPELCKIANLEVHVCMNIDSSRIGPQEWIKIAKVLDKNRELYDGFVIIHGTDTMTYTGSALSLMLAGFRKPVVLTGSQLPMSMARSDARQNLIDSVTVACSSELEEFAICFGGTLLRANRAIKSSSSAYRAFSSPTHPALAVLGVEPEWNVNALWKDPEIYRPRMKLDPSVVRIPVVPGVRPQMAYGDLVDRGIKGAVIESFGVGNMPDQKSGGWIDWLRQQRKKGLEVYLASQCQTGPLNPALYRSGSAALSFGAMTTRRMTSETAVVKLMLCLAYPDLHLSYPLAGEL